jgi:FkbM family methyltransferase
MKESFIQFPKGADIRKSTVFKRDFITLSLPGQEVFASIAGTELVVEFIKHPWSGMVEISIGNQVVQLDLYDKAQILFRFSAVIPAGASIVHIKALDPNLISNNTTDRGTQVWIGRIICNNLFEEPSDVSIIPIDDLYSLVEAKVGKFFVINNDLSVSSDIIHSGCFAEQDIELFKKIIKPEMYVYDIGANIGHHSVFFSKIVGSKGKVYSFEPQNYIFKILNANLALNNCKNTWSYRLALGSEKAKLKMYPIDYEKKENFGALGINLNANDKEATNSGETVDVILGDEFMNMLDTADKRVDFIKIDVQAFELFVLQGLTEVLSRFKPILFLEIAPYWMREMGGYDYGKIYDLLHGLGYNIFLPHESLENPISSTTAWNGEKHSEWDILAIAK